MSTKLDIMRAFEFTCYLGTPEQAGFDLDTHLDYVDRHGHRYVSRGRMCKFARIVCRYRAAGRRPVWSNPDFREVMVKAGFSRSQYYALKRELTDRELPDDFFWWMNLNRTATTLYLAKELAR